MIPGRDGGAPLLDARGLGFTYPDGTVALRDVDLTLEEGEVLGLLGANGSGKSTLLRLLAGTPYPHDGAVERLEGGVAGAALALDRPVFREWLGGLDNATALLRLGGRARAEARAAAGAWLERFDLGGSAARRVGAYSRGMETRLGLAVAFASGASVILLDEPLAALDPAGRSRLAGALAEARAARRGVLLTTHDPSFADTSCDRVGFLRGGRLVAIDTPAAFLEALGERTRIEVTLAGEGAGGEAARATAGLDASPGVRAVRALDRERIVLEVDEPADALPAALERLFRAGVRVGSVHVRPPDLGEAYFAITGARLESGEPG